MSIIRLCYATDCQPAAALRASAIPEVLCEIHRGHAALPQLAREAVAVGEGGGEAGHGGVSHGSIRLASFGTGRPHCDDTADDTPVVLGEPGDVEPLLGVVALEILGLVFDPFHRTLRPMRALLV